MKGTIKVLKEGFGFIQSDETENDVFFHMNNLEWVKFEELNPWDEVNFEIGEWKNWRQQWLNVSLV